MEMLNSAYQYKGEGMDFYVTKVISHKKMIKHLNQASCLVKKLQPLQLYQLSKLPFDKKLLLYNGEYYKRICDILINAISLHADVIDKAIASIYLTAISLHSLRKDIREIIYAAINDNSEFQEKYLNLSKMNLSSVEAMWIVNTLPCASIKFLNLCSNHIGDKGAKFISLSNSINSVSLCDNDIGNEGAKHLSKSSSIEVLDLFSNAIGDEGAEHLAKNKLLKFLDVGGNAISDECLKYFEENCQIKSIWLWLSVNLSKEAIKNSQLKNDAIEF